MIRRSCTVDRASGIQVTICTHHCNLCMGKDQRLPDKSWNRYFPGICSDVDYFKFRSDRICNRYQSEFRILYWESNRPALSACRSWILADHCRTDCRNCRKRSGCVQLQCPFRDTEYYNRTWHDDHVCHFGYSWIRSCKRIRSYGFLFALCTMHCYHRNNS